MNPSTLQMFQTLTELPGAPGFEHEIRRYMRGEIAKYTKETVQDRLGSLFGVLRGDEQGPRIMVNGHMDEVGFMVTHIQSNGLIKFQTLGGWWSQVLLAQRVHIITKQGLLPGVIGSTPPHLLDEAKRNKPTEISSMFIDIGADDQDEALAMGVELGLPIVPVCPFTPLAGGKKIMAKAWDNRYGVGLAIELLEALHEQSHPNIVYAGATVQEEVGLRGAQTAAAIINPDLCFTLDAGPANDTTSDPNTFGRIGKGVCLRVMDSSIIPNRTLMEFIQDTASTHQIPYQFFISAGATDAGKVHLHGQGVPTAVIGVCARYIHTAASILHTDDYAAAKELLVRLVQSMDRSTYETIVRFD